MSFTKTTVGIIVLIHQERDCGDKSVDVYRKFYSEEQEHGVVALRVKPIV
jgi:ASC-1-like (ASCH) protein